MSSPKGVLLFVGSGLKYYREYLMHSAAPRARAAGLDLVLVNNLRPTWQRTYFDEIVVVNTFDSPALAAAVHQVAARRRVLGLVCWDEPMVMSAAVLAHELGLPGLSLAGVHGCRDKYQTRQRLTAAGLLQPDFALVTSADQAQVAAAHIGFPVVVKPRALAASIGVQKAIDATELDAAYGVAARASLIGEEPFRSAVIVETYVDGPEISIEGAVHRGEYLPMFVAHKQTGLVPYFEEIGHIVDAVDPLRHDATLMGTLAVAHRALGVEDALTHTEVRLTDRGAFIMEVNGRLAGDLIPLLGKLATGIDTGEVLVDIALGRRPELATTRRRVVGIRFGYPEGDCVVRSVVVPTEAPGLVLTESMAAPGVELRLPPAGYLSRHSFVVCQAEDAATCARLLDEAIALVKVEAGSLDPPDPSGAPMMPAGLLDSDDPTVEVAPT